MYNCITWGDLSKGWPHITCACVPPVLPTRKETAPAPNADMEKTWLTIDK